MTVHNYRLMCLNGMLLRDGRPCEDCVGRSPWAGVRHRCYRDSVIASTAAAATIVYNRRRRRPGPTESLCTWLPPRSCVAGSMAGVSRGPGPGQAALRRRPRSPPGPPSRRRPSCTWDVSRPTRGPTSCSMPGLHCARAISSWCASATDHCATRCHGAGSRESGCSAPSRLPRSGTGCCAPGARRSSIWYETFGLVVAEAMAAGLPVIVPRVGALAEVAAGKLLSPRRPLVDSDSSRWSSSKSLQRSGRRPGSTVSPGGSGGHDSSASFRPGRVWPS